MKKITYTTRFIFCLSLLLLPVPWFAESWLTQQWAGLPIWLLYSTAMTLLITVIIAILFSIAWNDGESSENE